MTLEHCQSLFLNLSPDDDNISIPLLLNFDSKYPSHSQADYRQTISFYLFFSQHRYVTVRRINATYIEMIDELYFSKNPMCYDIQ